MKIKLTDRAITRKPPAEGQIELWDKVLPGFGLRIGHGGKRTYFIMVRINGKQRRLTVENAELIGLADARDKARQMMRDAAKGIDPNERERIERREVQKARQDTFAGIAEMFMTERGSKRKSGATMQRILDKDILPEIGHLPIAEITRADVKEMLIRKAETAPVAANRALALIRPIFVYAQDEERIDTVPNFRNLMQEETARDRVLSDAELRDVWLGAGKVGHPFGSLIKFLIVTGQRRGEASGLVRVELDGETWKLPSERVKNGEGHTVPISPLAQAIINAGPADADLVFAAWRRVERDGKTVMEAGPLTGWSNLKARLDRCITEIRGEPLPHWTIHDCRRSAATGMQSLGITDEVIDRVLNHVLPGVRRTYNRFSRDPEKKIALDIWARHVEAVVSGEPAPSNVVEINRPA